MCAPESAGREPEETMVPRRLLLVGEGNFSFTASLIDTLDPGVSVTATCLQQPADVDGDPVTQENLQRLRERGMGPTPPPDPAQSVEVWLAWGMRVRLLETLTWKCCVPRPGLDCGSVFVWVTDFKTSLVCISTFFARYRCSFWCGLHPAGTRLAGTRQRL